MKATDPPTTAPPAQSSVFHAVSAVSAALAAHGIGKTRSNEQQRYRFRGIDEVMNALAPLLVQHRLLIVPRMLERECEERTTKTGAILFSVCVTAEFDFVSVMDGSLFTVRNFGEAMDSADKATNKAMAVAYKYAAFQTFCIPTEGGGDVDADAVTHEETVARKSAWQARRDGRYPAIERALRNAKTMRALQAVWHREQAIIAGWPAEWQVHITEEKDRCKVAIEAKGEVAARLTTDQLMATLQALNGGPPTR